MGFLFQQFCQNFTNLDLITILVQIETLLALFLLLEFSVWRSRRMRQSLLHFAVLWEQYRERCLAIARKNMKDMFKVRRANAEYFILLQELVKPCSIGHASEFQPPTEVCHMMREYLIKDSIVSAELLSAGLRY